MNNQPKPSIFIGSSVEGLDVARSIQMDLRYDADCVVWPQGVFGVGSVPILDLVGMADRVDFAVFVFTPDDVLHYRKQEVKAVRDNVLFEYGLFAGKLGINRVFFVIPEGGKDLHLPTDLTGITPAKYRHTNELEQLLPNVAQACYEIRIQLRKLGPVPRHADVDGLRSSIATLESHARFLLSILETSDRIEPKVNAVLGAFQNEFQSTDTIKIKGTTLFQLTEDGKALQQIGCSGSVKEDAKRYPLDYNESNPHHRSYVVDSFLSKREAIGYTGKKYGSEKELILCLPVAEIFALTVHLLSKEQDSVLRDRVLAIRNRNEDLLYYLETILERGALS